jgi:hypothetical protein
MPFYCKARRLSQQENSESTASELTGLHLCFFII